MSTSNTINTDNNATTTISIHPLDFEYMNQNTFEENHNHYHHQTEHYPIINMNDNTQYDGYTILQNNVTTTVQNQNNVISYVDLQPEPLVNMENNTFVDNNDPALENVYVMMNVTTDNNNTENNNEDGQYEVDINNMNLAIPQLMRSGNAE